MTKADHRKLEAVFEQLERDPDDQLSDPGGTFTAAKEVALAALKAGG